MTVTRFMFGTLDGVPVPGFVIENRLGWRAVVMAHGARLVELHVPDRDGRLADVVLGYDTLGDYVDSTTFFGATCGRFGNRIAEGRTSFDGRPLHLALNDGPNHLHGGPGGFDRVVWAATPDETTESVLFFRASPDGEEGYPGTLLAATRYRVTDDALEIVMSATTDAPTLCSMLHHSYWNLAGHASGDVRSQQLRIDADFRTPVDPTLIPTGAIVPVAGTAWDFTRPRSIGDALDAVGGSGFDDNFCLRGASEPLRPVVEMHDPASGRSFELSSNQPGMQLYSAGAFPAEGIRGKGGVRYPRHAGIALETQKFPDSPNVGHFPPARLEPGVRYENRVRFRFFVR